MKIVIYGARGIALGTYRAMKSILPAIRIECFLVTSLSNNPEILEGLPVRELEEFVDGMTQEEKNNVEVLIGTPENVMLDVEQGLIAAGLNNYVKIDSLRWADMQARAYSITGEFKPLCDYMEGLTRASLRVYKMVHIKDKPLQSIWEDPDYITTVQVGAALTDQRIATLTDDSDINISNRNGNYSELTGLYWVWRNCMSNIDSDTYFGLAHYRRLLQFSENDLKRIRENDIDVVLPYPIPYQPNIEVHHFRYLCDVEWDATLQALYELQPMYAKMLKKILEQNYLFNYNIFVAKQKVFDDYCSWLFPILFRIEEIVNTKWNRNPNRYIGYISETLETLYFMYNKNRLKIAHTGCRFLV